MLLQEEIKKFKLDEFLKSKEEIELTLLENEKCFRDYNGLEKIIKINENFKKIEIKGSHFELFLPKYIEFTSNSIQNEIL